MASKGAKEKGETKSTFEKLVGMDVNKYKEQKGRFDYLLSLIHI